MSTIHQSARDGFAAKAEAYAKGRPDYPPDVVDWLTVDIGLGVGKTALDLGSGTGKFLPFLEATGATVLAVEPVAEMRAQLRARNRNVTALEGTAARIPLPDASVDAVVCAQAFHWFATSDALAEIARVLKPSCALGLIWNNRDTDTPWVAAIEALTDAHLGDTPSQKSGAWKEAFHGSAFAPLQARSFPHGHTGGSDTVIVDRILSVSYIATLQPDEQDAFVAKLRTIIADTPALAGQSEVTFPYKTAAYWCRKR